MYLNVIGVLCASKRQLTSASELLVSAGRGR